MSLYTPSSHVFKWKKYTPLPVPVVIFYSNDFFPEISNFESFEIINLPPWLEAYNIWYNETTYNIEFSLRIKEVYALSMTEGLYASVPSLKLRYYHPELGWITGEVTNAPPLNISLNLLEGQLLSITPTTKVYTYTIGGVTPESYLFQITADSNWNITASESWVTLSTVLGVGNGTVVVGVDPTGLPVGSYSSYITITDSILTRNVVITLNIDEGDTDTSYLYLNNRSLQFVSELGIANTKEFVINAETSHAWTATPSDAWLVVSNTSGSAGISDITVSVNSITSSIGTYNGSILFECNGILKKVYVTLIVLEYLVEGITSETIYFSEDRNKLKATNIANNTFLVIDAVTSNGINNYSYQMEAPYFNGIAEVVIGEETPNLLKSVTPTNSFITGIQNSIKPTSINLTAFNENKITEALTQFAQFSNLRFLTGKTPEIENKLCYIPSTVYVTKNAVLSLSVLATTAPTQITITGAVETSISTSIEHNLYVYNAIVNLSDFTLATGDTIAIDFGSLTVNVVIKKDEPEVNIIAFENEWRAYEFFETTGFLTKTPNATKTTTELQVEGEKQTKVVSIDNGVDYVLDTGWIYTQEEKEWLAKILASNRVFLYVNNEPIEIDLTTKSLEVYKTREHSKSYNLKFKKAII